MFNLTTTSDNGTFSLDCNLYRLQYDFSVVSLDDVKEFALIGGTADYSKKGTSLFLERTRLYTPEAVREYAITSGVYPYSWKGIAAVESALNKNKDCSIVKSDNGLELVRHKDSTVPLVVLQGLATICACLRKRKSRNKKELSDLLAKRYTILDIVANNPESEAEQYREVFFNLESDIEKCRFDYERYNPEVLDKSFSLDSSKKHEDYAMALNYFNYESAWETAISKAKQYSPKTYIAKESDKKTPLEKAMALLDKVEDLELRLELKELLAQV